jgi:hypothetical protein
MKFNSPKELMDFLRENEGKRYNYTKDNDSFAYDSDYIFKGDSPYRYITNHSNSTMRGSFEYSYDKDWQEVTRFEDKQPVYCWDDSDYVVMVGYWDTKNNTIRYGSSYQNYEPVDMDTIPDKLREKILADQAKWED